MKPFFAFVALSISLSASAQFNGFEFGRVSASELSMKVYDKDTSAAALVLYEFGEGYIDNSGDHNLIFQYHVKIKILKKSGLQYADIQIPLRRQDNHFEQLRSVEASSFNIIDGQIMETKLDEKSVFTINKSQSLDVKKFAIPNVSVGTVIEFMYELESPFIYNFRRWEFQSDIPKVFSEYWATIPANYVYNITLRGFYKLTKNESELLRGCFTPGAEVADCVRSKYAMTDIPAFIEEDYMTARSNFLSAINFELSEIKYFDGRVDKVTKNWKDAELEMQRHTGFGVQLKRGKGILEDHVDGVVAGVSDPLTRAKQIYDFIKAWYRWDDTYGKFSESGIKKAFEKKSGNVGDINLSLIAALQYAGLDVEPVILSTRSNGLPVELHPVLSDFNYVVAKINIGDKVYLADATDDFYPFGVLPERCLNGKGRVLNAKQSYWIDLKPEARARRISMLDLTLTGEGVITGTIQTTYNGYEGVKERKKIASFSNYNEYIRHLDDQFASLAIQDFEMKHVDDIDKSLIVKLKVEMQVSNENEEVFLFDPFILGKWNDNPFKSSERLYPVDFATTMEFITILSLHYTDNFQIVDPPEKAGFYLPDAGGRYIYDVQITGNHLKLNNALRLDKPVFSPTEYLYLKELFTHIIQLENADLIFKRKE